MEKKDNKDLKIKELNDEQLSEVSGGASDHNPHGMIFSACLRRFTKEECCIKYTYQDECKVK